MLSLWRIIEGALVVGCAVVLIPRIHAPKSQYEVLQGDIAGAQNRTLGFDSLVVVSAGTPWRLNGLQNASNFTGIQLKTPSQPHWSDIEVDRFRGIHDPSRDTQIGPGQTRAWLGHLNAIQYMITHGYTTALIMEDDVDWDISIKQQLDRVAPLIQQVSGSGKVNLNDSRSSPYGDAWDLLWLGHCYDRIPYNIPAAYLDHTLPDSSLYFENDGQYTSFPQYLRMVYMSEAPACMYAYALTAASAAKVYELARDGMDRDVSYHFKRWCQTGVLRCVTVNPELFHQHKQQGERSSEIAVIEGWQEESVLVRHSFTPNIRYSARCNSQSNKLVQCQFVDGS